MSHLEFRNITYYGLGMDNSRNETVSEMKNYLICYLRYFSAWLNSSICISRFMLYQSHLCTLCKDGFISDSNYKKATQRVFKQRLFRTFVWHRLGI